MGSTSHNIVKKKRTLFLLVLYLVIKTRRLCSQSFLQIQEQIAISTLANIQSMQEGIEGVAGFTPQARRVTILSLLPHRQDKLLLLSLERMVQASLHYNLKVEMPSQKQFQ